MIGFAVSFVAWTASTIIPSLAGLFLITLASKKFPATYLAAFAFGILFWFFVDTISGSADLDVNSGFTGGTAEGGVIVLFLAGVLLLFWVDRKRNIFSPELAIGKYGMTIPLLVAVAVGIHGLGEGAAFGATAYSTSSTSLLTAFGGVSAGVAYVLHKALEPMMIGACYCVYKTETVSFKRWIRDLATLDLLFVIPSLIGAVSGYFLVYDTTYAFALGTGTSVYAAFRLAGSLFVARGSVSKIQPMKMAVSWTLGFMAIYFAALFHA